MRKRIITALLAAAMMTTALAGCYTEVPAPDDSSDTSVTTSAESKDTTTTKPSTTTSKASSTTTTSNTSKTSSKKAPTTAKFKYSLIKRLKQKPGNNGGSTGSNGGTGNTTTPSTPGEDVNENEYYYDTWRDFVNVGDNILAQARKNANMDDPISGGLWRPNNRNVVVSLSNEPDKNGNIPILSDATLWPYGAYMEGVGAQIADDPDGSYFSKPEYEKLLKNVTNFTDNRYNTTDSLGLCCVQGGGPAQVFNDDNVWIALEWMEAYKTLKNNEYLTLAKRNLNFIYESWDETTLDGGIWWMRPGTEGGESRQKNACINAPFAWAAAEMYELSGDAKYLEQAKNAYNWTKEKLWDDSKDLIQDKWAMDPATGVYSKDGSLYAYNTGCMIGAGAVLYQATGDTTFRDDAYKLAEGSKNNYFSERITIRSDEEEAAGATGYYFGALSPQNDSDRCWFRSNLVKGIFELYNADKAMGNDADPQYARIALNAIAVGGVNAGRSGNYINPDFKNTAAPALSVITPTSQGSAARMMFMASTFLKENRDFPRIPE